MHNMLMMMCLLCGCCVFVVWMLCVCCVDVVLMLWSFAMITCQNHGGHMSNVVCD